jgi:hypothetical protein
MRQAATFAGPDFHCNVQHFYHVVLRLFVTKPAFSISFREMLESNKHADLPVLLL